MKYCYVYSHNEFDALCKMNGWNDSNLPREIAFISICCTPSCRENCLEFSKGETDEHWFHYDHPTVCNVDFDDITTDTMEGTRPDGVKYTVIGMTNSQAQKLYDFITANSDKNFIIHCRAGKSRSQGVCRFITTLYDDYKTREDNPCLYPNILVYNKLSRISNGIPLEE